MSLSAALIATHRFGMGTRPGDLRAASVIRLTPRAWLLAQLAEPGEPRALRRLKPAAVRVAELAAAREGISTRKELRKKHRVVYQEEALARTLVGIQTEQPFQERLVRFFSNLLTVSVARAQCLGLVGAFEREVIRPGVLGRFSDLLISATKHPAMQVYLDNFRSVGPDSPFGIRRKADSKGRNENLAREILELHTVGVAAGYSQDDVIALADMLTGWGIDPEHGFAFSPRRHQPGAQTLLGVDYPDTGASQGEAALTALARHPATARRLARRMARHFIADAPPESVVSTLEAAYRESDGSIAAMAAALVQHDAAWQPGFTRLRCPDELVIAAIRATHPAPVRLDGAQEKQLLSTLRQLGQMPWSAPSPEGWSDTDADWLGGDALLSRLTWGQEYARAVADSGSDPQDLIASILPGVLSDSTRAALAAAPDRAMGVALFLASPAFQRR